MSVVVALCMAAAIWLLVVGPTRRRPVTAVRSTSTFEWRLPGVQRLRERTLVRQRHETAADLIELLTVVVGSGGTVSMALRLAASHGPAPTREPLQELQQQMAVGVPLSLALIGSADQLGPGYRATISALLASERDGAPLSVLLVRLGDEARSSRRRQAEARARRLPVQLLFPLVFCSLPAVLVGAVVPLIVLSLNRL